MTASYWIGMDTSSATAMMKSIRKSWIPPPSASLAGPTGYWTAPMEPETTLKLDSLKIV